MYTGFGYEGKKIPNANKKLAWSATDVGLDTFDEMDMTFFSKFPLIDIQSI